MKIKIEADLNLPDKQILPAVFRALAKTDTQELFKAFPPGEDFRMDNQNGYIRITKEPGQVCRICGCTDANCQQCIEKTGHPCHWIEEDLCSACQKEALAEELKDAVVTLSLALLTEDDYFDRWREYVAIAIQDEFSNGCYGPIDKSSLHRFSNEAARRFLLNLIAPYRKEKSPDGTQP
jgi:hypothetical protein